eukprot:XP_011436147.1 PREDICTED: uncharacterized protein LOC105334399 [Crassostrea gigas]
MDKTKKAVVFFILLFYHQLNPVEPTRLCLQLQATVAIFATIVFTSDYVGGKDVSLEKVILFIAAYLLAQCPKEGNTHTDEIPVTTTTTTTPPTTKPPPPPPAR